MSTGVLFDTKTSKYITLIPNNARFTTNIDNATPVEQSVFDDEMERFWLLDHHNIDWYMPTITWRPLEPKPEMTPSM